MPREDNGASAASGAFVDADSGDAASVPIQVEPLSPLAVTQSPSQQPTEATEQASVPHALVDGGAGSTSGPAEATGVDADVNNDSTANDPNAPSDPADGADADGAATACATSGVTVPARLAVDGSGSGSRRGGGGNPLIPLAKDALQSVDDKLRLWEAQVEKVATGQNVFGALSANAMLLPNGKAPLPSYFIHPTLPPPHDAAANVESCDGAAAHPSGPLKGTVPRAGPTATSGQRSSYQPRSLFQVDALPKALAGRELELHRFFGKCPTPKQIPIYDQACLKYIFTDSFDNTIDPMEWITATSFVLSILTNCASAVANLQNSIAGGAGDGAGGDAPEWVVQLSKIVFAVEFAVVYGLLLFFFGTIADAVYHDNVASDLASDLVSLGQRISGFSSIKIVGWVSPGYAARFIMPHVQAAVDWRRRMRVVLYVMLYLGGCCLAAATVILKVTQIDFAATVPIGSWSSTNWLALVGFIMNLAKVDDSYATETRCLLNAVHQHFCLPGEPTDENPQSEALYSRVLRHAGIRREAYYEYFEVVFDFHFSDVDAVPANMSPGRANSMSPTSHRRSNAAGAAVRPMSWTSKFKRFMNFLTFILKIDNALLRKFLQMTSSPLLFYAQGRESFRKAFEEGDVAGMDMALWRSDPEDPRTVRWAIENEQCFNIVFQCDDPITHAPQSTDTPPSDRSPWRRRAQWGVVNNLKPADRDDDTVTHENSTTTAFVGAPDALDGRDHPDHPLGQHTEASRVFDPAPAGGVDGGVTASNMNPMEPPAALQQPVLPDTQTTPLKPQPPPLA